MRAGRIAVAVILALTLLIGTTVRAAPQGVDQLEEGIGHLESVLRDLVNSPDLEESRLERAGLSKTLALLTPALQHLAPEDTAVLQALVEAMASDDISTRDVADLGGASLQALVGIRAGVSRYRETPTKIQVDVDRILRVGHTTSLAVYVQDSPAGGFAAFEGRLSWDPAHLDVQGARLAGGKGVIEIRNGSVVFNGISVGQVVTAQVAGDVSLLAIIEVEPKHPGSVFMAMDGALFDPAGARIPALPVGGTIEVK